MNEDVAYACNTERRWNICFIFLFLYRAHIDINWSRYPVELFSIITVTIVVVIIIIIIIIKSQEKSLTGVPTPPLMRGWI